MCQAVQACKVRLGVLCAVFCLGASSTAPKTVRLNNGYRMPVLALGTAGYDNQTVAAAVEHALDVGFTHIHTAFNYYNLPGVANGLKSSGKRRYDIFLTSMTSACIHGPFPPARNVTDADECYNLTWRELHSTLAALQVDHVDLMLLHGPSEIYGHTGGCDELACKLNQAQWRAYQDFYLEGKAWAIGLSNFCASCLDCLINAPQTNFVPAVNQLQWHVGLGPNPEELLSYCDSKNIIVQAYSPLASGQVVNDTDCMNVGQKYNKTAAQTGLAWIFGQTNNRTVVVKASNPTFLKQDMDSLNLKLSSSDMAMLNAKHSPIGSSDGRPSWGCTK